VRRIDSVDLSSSSGQDDELLEAELISEQVGGIERSRRKRFAVASTGESTDKAGCIAWQILQEEGVSGLATDSRPQTLTTSC